MQPWEFEFCEDVKFNNLMFGLIKTVDVLIMMSLLNLLSALIAYIPNKFVQYPSQKKVIVDSVPSWTH